jgi:hypothetical protein
MSASFLAAPQPGPAWPPEPPQPLPLLAAQIALTVRPGWPGEPTEVSSLAALAEDIAAALRLEAPAPIGLDAVLPPPPQEAWQREPAAESLLPATGGLALSDLLWLG